MSKVLDEVLLPFKERMADWLDFDLAGPLLRRRPARSVQDAILQRPVRCRFVSSVSAARCTSSPAQPPSRPLTDTTTGAPPDTTGSLGKRPGGPGGNRADILPGRYRDKRSADRPARKCGSRRRTITD